MGFLKEHIELGTVKVGSKNVVEFKWGEKTSLQIKDMRTSCGCTSPGFNKKTGVLTATYTAGKVPKHLLSVGKYTTTKRITVDENRGERHILTFAATVVI